MEITAEMLNPRGQIGQNFWSRPRSRPRNLWARPSPWDSLASASSFWPWP